MASLLKDAVLPSGWGAKVDTTKPWSDDPKYKPTLHIVHYGGGPNPAGVAPYSQEAEKGVLRGWEHWHMTGRGMRSLAYNWAVGQTGTLYYGRGDQHSNGGQYGDINYRSRAVVFILGGTQIPSPAARATFGRLWLEQPLAGKVACHLDYYATACPGDWLTKWVRRQGYIEDLGVWHEGQSDPVVCSLKVRLNRLGFWLFPSYGPVFTAGFRRAVQNFQTKQGLAPDGVVGPKTIAAMCGVDLENFEGGHGQEPPTIPAVPAPFLPGRKDWGPKVERWRSLMLWAFRQYGHPTEYDLDFGLGIVSHESGGDHLAICKVEWIGPEPPGYDGTAATRATGLCAHVPAFFWERAREALGREGVILDPVDQLLVMGWLVFHKPEKAPNWQHWPDPPGHPGAGSASKVKAELAALYD